MDVATWLRELGLERYELAFRDNDIDARVLPRLTADDLVAIGVTSVGHRRMLLDAIASLSTTKKPEANAASIPVVASERQSLRVAEAERRQLAARIGIATGLVMVGELIGEGVAQEQTVVGEAPNLAARLQALAMPGKIVVSHMTLHLVGGLFEVTDLGPVRLKGFAEPLAAWSIEGEARTEGRFEALHGAVLTPLVGREYILALLLERWERAKDREGQVILLSGEAGFSRC
jgi:SAM domain (Sterile alpha motif)/Adenylate and Guanylate cyclase catalytic domain